jgi:hypothetical protein
MKETPPVMDIHGWEADYIRSFSASTNSDLGLASASTVLPAFSGNVPAAISKIYPNAKITRLGEWNTVDGDPRWCCTYLLDPTDPLFVEIGKAFILQQIEEYGGTQHIYNWLVLLLLWTLLTFHFIRRAPLSEGEVQISRQHTWGCYESLDEVTVIHYMYF